MEKPFERPIKKTVFFRYWRESKTKGFGTIHLSRIDAETFRERREARGYSAKPCPLNAFDVSIKTYQKICAAIGDKPGIRGCIQNFTS